MPEQGSSFIPKSGVKTVQRTRSSRRIYVLAYISYIVFFSTLFVVVGVYLYAATVSRSLSSLKSQLVTEQQRFSLTDLDSVRNLDSRMQSARKLLDETSSPSRIFTDIETIVASNIYFSSLSYEQLPNRKFKIELVGQASNFDQIISQRNLLKNSEILKDATVTTYDYSVAGEGGTTSGALLGRSTLAFTFSDTRDLSLISYKVDPANIIVPQQGADADTVEVLEGMNSNEVGNNVNVVGDVRPDLPNQEATLDELQSQ